MIRYLLDTNVTSQAGKHKPNKNALKWLASVNDDELAVSVITLRERLEGAERARQAGSPSASDIAADVEDLVRAYADRILLINEDAARYWARLLVPDNSKSDDKAQLAIAAAHGLTLVTLNWKDVQGRGVSVLNPGRDPPKLYDP
jgi:predicted nucleic acid-binding protein